MPSVLRHLLDFVSKLINLTHTMNEPSLIMTREEWERRKPEILAEAAARKNPAHEKWKGAKFDMADSSTRLLFMPNGKTLIYWDGDDYSENIILPSSVVKCIVDHYSTRL